MNRTEKGLLPFLQQYNASGVSRFHMPAHKGNFPLYAGLPLSRLDITEVQGADSLYESDGVIAETEARLAAVYGSRETLLSAGGNTLCIQAMLSLAARPGGRVVCTRNLHVSAVNAMALLGLEPVFVYPDRDRAGGLPGTASPAAYARALSGAPDACAVYLTTPDYFGVRSDVAGIAAVCRARGVPLLVDNAHGAHLRFLSPDRHPLPLGASLCADSAHKTLPVFTGGAYLHIGDPSFDRAAAKDAMALFGSTSPSYLTMLSLDACASYLETGARRDFAALCQTVADLEALAVSKGFSLPAGDRDPTRLSLGTLSAGCTGEQFAQHLRAHGIEPEYTARGWVVLLPSPFNTPADFDRLRRALEAFVPAQPLPCPAPEALHPARVMTLREAVLAPCELLPVAQCEGRVAACAKSPCPPGVPLVMPGEKITGKLKNLLADYGLNALKVVK